MWHFVSIFFVTSIISSVLQKPQKTETKNRSSRSQIFYKKRVLTNFAKFTGKHLCWSLFLITLPALRPATLLKRNSNTVVFLWIWEIFINTFFTEHFKANAFERSEFSDSIMKVLPNFRRASMLVIVQPHKFVSHNI